MIDPAAFRAAFGVGADTDTIHSVDQLGVVLVAVKGLYELIERNQRELAELRKLIEMAEAAG